MADRGEHIEQRFCRRWRGPALRSQPARYRQHGRSPRIPRRASDQQGAGDCSPASPYAHARNTPWPSAHDGARLCGHHEPGHRPPRCVSHRSARCNRRAPQDRSAPAHSQRARCSTAIPAIQQGKVPPSAEAKPAAREATGSAARGAASSAIRTGPAVAGASVPASVNTPGRLPPERHPSGSPGSSAPRRQDPSGSHSHGLRSPSPSQSRRSEGAADP